MSEKKLTAVTPRGVVIWANTREKDDEGKLSIRMKFPKEGAENQEEIDNFLDQLDVWQEEAQVEILETTPSKDKKKVAKHIENTNPLYSDGDESDSEQVQEHWIFGGKTSYPIKLIDSKRKSLARSNISLMAGDVGKLKVSFKPYTSSGLKKAGLTVYPQTFQILEKGEGDLSGFEDEEGFEADDYDGGGYSDEEDYEDYEDYEDGSDEDWEEESED